MREDAEDFERIGEIGADDDLAEPVIRRGSRPALGGPAGGLGRRIARRLAVRREGNRKPDFLGKGQTPVGIVGPKVIGRRPQPALAGLVAVLLALFHKRRLLCKVPSEIGTRPRFVVVTDWSPGLPP